MLGDASLPGCRPLEMSPVEVIVVDRAVRRRASPPDGASVIAAAAQLRRSGGWWAGLVDGSSREGLEVRLRRRDVGVFVVDPLGRGVVWIDDVVQLGVAGSVAPESIVAGCGPLWAPRAARGGPAKAWRALHRAHARAWLERNSGLSSPLWRRLSSDEGAAVQRAVRAWLQGQEVLAVQLIHSAFAGRVARAEPGYRLPGDRSDRASRRPSSVGGSGAG